MLVVDVRRGWWWEHVGRRDGMMHMVRDYLRGNGMIIELDLLLFGVAIPL